MELAPIVTRNYYHSVEVTGNAILGDQHITIGPQERTAADGRRSHFLASIKDPDMNARRNDIHETKYDTFEWIMRDGAGDGEKMPNLTRWLSSRQGKFFIQGKAGSGKSTLMKFVVEHKKTRDLLSEWSRKCSLLFHAFWIAGSKIQRSFKGLLASLVFQIIQQNHHLLYKIVYDADAKTCLSDWSTKELSQLLLTLIHDRSHAYCIFVDGLDEHDNSEDIDVVLDLIEDLTALTNVKVCVSSRPVLHIIEWAAGSPMLSLHEVTANDIKTYVTKTLDSRLKSSHSSQDDLRGIDGLARELCEKANGVFLWIYYVMRNVLKCSRNGDNTDAIRKQVATLPAGMSALYRQMWERQNLDNKFYANEARKIFSHGFERPMNVFLFAVSMNTEIRMQYLSEVGRLDQTILNKLCQEARRKLITRCAGLLECVQNPYKKIYSPRYKRYIARGVDKTQPPWWKTCSIQYFHRTAYDFVNNSPDGSNLTVSMHPRPPIREIVEASLACFIEDVYPLTSDMVKEYCLMPLSKFVRSDHRFVEETMNSINRVCMTLLQQRLKVDDRLRKENWIVWLGMDYRPWTPIDLTSTLLHSNISSNWMLDYIRSCTDTWSPYYRGYAVLRASQAYSTKFLGQAQQDSVDLKMPLQVINMLVQRGADLCTPQCYLFMRDPEISSAGSYLLSLLARTILTSDLMLRLDELQSLSSTLLHSALPETFSLRLASSGYIRDTSWWSYTWDQGITVLLTFKSKDFLMILRRLLNNELRQHCNGGSLLTCDLSKFRADLISLPKSTTIVGRWKQIVRLQPDGELRQDSSSIALDHVEQALINAYNCQAAPPAGQSEPFCNYLFRTGITKAFKYGRQEPLDGPLYDVDMSIPLHTPLLSLDSGEDVNLDNWKQKGMLKEYYAKLEQKEGNIQQNGATRSATALCPSGTHDQASINIDGPAHLIPRKRKRSDTSGDAERSIEPIDIEI